MNSLTDGALAGARQFPEGFLWGAGTSSYQIEGAVAADGRGPSIWDVFTHRPGTIFRGDSGDIACGSYNNLDEDVRILSDLGVSAYRFSVSWPRVQPTGSGAVNQTGLDYYRRLVEQLRAHGIAPVLNVYHWDLPQRLEEQGGWARRDTAERLAELAAILATALADQVQMWGTVNEPLQTVHQGYRVGTHAPGHQDAELAAAATHHILLGHGLALQALRGTAGAEALIGPSLDPHPYLGLDPAGERVADALDAEYNRMYLDPILLGRYPDGARVQMLPPQSVIRDGDMELIGAPVDFLGVNYYRPHYIRAGDLSDLRLGESPVAGFPEAVEYMAPDLERTVMGWSIVPDALAGLLKRLDRESGGLPLYITENGCAADDYISPQGTIEDDERIAYIHSHLEAAWQAMTAGVKLAGYFHWSLMDNFEWAEGYRRRFGLYYVDFETGRRTPKRSAAFYAKLSRGNVLPPLEEVLPAAAQTPEMPTAAVV